MKKILTLILLFTLLLSVSCLSSFAAEASDASAPSDVSTVSETGETDSLIGSDSNGESATLNGTAIADTDTESHGSGTEDDVAYENPLSVLFDVIMENADKLLSALSFIGTLVIMFLFKRGLLPILSGGVGAVAKGVQSLEEQTKKQIDGSEALGSLISQKLAESENTVSRIEESVGALENRCARALLDGKSSAAIFNAMSMQTELLMEILMSSSLPAYEKERVGEKISEIKAQLTNGGGDGDSLL